MNVLSDALIVDCSSDDRQSYLEFLSIAGMPEGVLNEKLSRCSKNTIITLVPNFQADHQRS